MKYVILGGVAAGTKAAAKLKRLDRKAEVKIFTKSRDILCRLWPALLYRRRHSHQRRADREFAGKICRYDRRSGRDRMRGYRH